MGEHLDNPWEQINDMLESAADACDIDLPPKSDGEVDAILAMARLQADALFNPPPAPTPTQGYPMVGVRATSRVKAIRPRSTGFRQMTLAESQAHWAAMAARGCA